MTLDEAFTQGVERSYHEIPKPDAKAETGENLGRYSGSQ